MASTYLQRTNTTPTQLKKYTVSVWFKKGLNATSQYIYSNYQDSNNRAYIVFLNNDTIYVYDKEGGTDRLEMTSNFVCRDVNAWYHIVYAVDYRAGGASGAFTDRVKFYVNGVNRTADFTVASSFGYNSNTSFQIGTTSNKHNIGCGDNAQLTFDGSISHVNFVDGTQLDASVFGETDTTTGEWKINPSPTVSEYGNNGYFILKNSNSVTDQSGKSNNFTVGAGTLTKTEDNPSNVFATLNPLDKGLTSTSFNLSNGNLTMGNASNTNDYGLRGTLGASSGKYYWEIKIVNGGEVLAVTKSDTRLTINNMDGTPDAGFWGWQSNGTGASINSYNNGTFSNSNALQGYANNSIIGVALDMDNGKLYMSINGVFKGADNNTSDPVNQTNPFYTTIPTDGTFIMPYTEHRSSGDPASHWNFGNGYFGTTAVSSAGTNASGNGIFDYDVLTDYTALSTKGLNL